MSVSREIEKYISTYHKGKYDEFKRLKHGIKNINIVNPLRKKENEEIQLVRMLLDPNYCYFTCKHILGVNLMPYQAFAINQIYNHARPLILASRGWAKCINGNSLVHTTKGIKKIKDLMPENYQVLERYQYNDYLLGENGFNEIDYVWSNGKTKTIDIKTSYGFGLEGTIDHPVRVIDNGKITWKEMNEIKIGDKVPVYRKIYDTPNYSGLEENEAYLLGLIIGDGCYTQKGFIGFTTADEELADKVSDLSLKYFGKSFVDVPSAKYDYRLYGVKYREELFTKYKFNSAICAEKNVPELIFKASNSVIAAFLRGLFDTDGYCSKTEVGICAKSKGLIENIQLLLLRLGILSCLYTKYNKKYNRNYYALYIGSNDSVIFKEQIDFGLMRKKKKLEFLCSRNRNPNRDVVPKELLLNEALRLREKYIAEANLPRNCYERSLTTPWRLKAYDFSYKTLNKVLELMSDHKDDSDWKYINQICENNYFYDVVTEKIESENETFDVHLKSDHSFISNGFISHNTFTLGLYAMYRAFIRPGTKVVIVGSGFRQSKMVFEVCEKIWGQADVLRDILGSTGARNRTNGPHYSPDQLTMTVGKSEIIAIPIGVGGSKIRGFRSNCIIADEFDSHDLDIFERVIKGFGAVSEDPAEKVKIQQALQAAEKLGITQSQMGINIKESFNQEIIAGTVTYKAGNLGNYYDKYKAIIEAAGKIEVLKQLRGNDYDKLIGIDHRHYCVFRVPYHMLPQGYLSKVDIESAKATSSSEIFNSEYGCVFLDDSAGFFRKALIDSCAANFLPLLRANPDGEYVIGVDPASESDNCAIKVLEVYNNQKRVVYCYTTNRKKFNKEQADSKTIEKRFYGYAARKIYEIANAFGLQENKVLRIDIDSEGGGREIRDELASIEDPIFELVDFYEPKPNDNKKGFHIIKLVNFQDYKWVSAANHGLKRDMEQRNLLFPKYDPYQMLASELINEKAGFERLKNVKLLDNETVDDTIESVYDEIEATKKEMTSIIVKLTANGRESWTLPGKKSEIALQTSELKKDRYSALLIANAAANEITRNNEASSIPDNAQYGILADKIQKTRKKPGEGQMFYGPSPYLSQINGLPCGIVKR